MFRCQHSCQNSRSAGFCKEWIESLWTECVAGCVCVYGFTALLFLRGRVHVQSICLYLRHELLMSGCQHRRTPVSLGGSTGLEEPWGAAGFYSLCLCLHIIFSPPPEPSVTWHHFASIIIHKHTKKRYFSLFSSSPRSDFFFPFEVVVRFLLCGNMCPSLDRVMPTNNHFVKTHLHRSWKAEEGWEKLARAPSCRAGGTRQECY